jgi:PAS domain S-box-containing protein
MGPEGGDRNRGADGAETFRAVFERAPVAIGISRGGVALDANDALVRLFGYESVEDVRGRDIFEHFVPEAREGIARRAAARARGEDEPASYETVALRRDGTRFPIQVSVAVVDLADGPAFAAFMVDLSELRAAKRAVAEGERRHQLHALALSQTSDAVVTTDLRGRVTSWNPAAERIYGYRAQEVVGRELMPALQSRFVAPVSDQFVAEMLLTTGQWRGEVQQVAKSGRTLVVEASVSLLREEGGAPLGGIAVLRDVTTQRALEEDLRRSQRMEAVGVLAGGVAQDFGALLRSVLACAEAAKQLPPDHPVRAELERVRGEAERATALTERLLALASRQVLRRDRFDLREMVGELAPFVARTVGARVSVVVDGTSEPLPIAADAVQIEQSILELAANAREAMRSGGELRLETRRRELDDDFVQAHPWARRGAFAELTVADTGSGMDETTRARIFEPFVEDDTGRVGLGLSTVYGVVRQHDGFVSVQSEPGRGSTFRIYLPLEEREPTGVTQRPFVRGGKETILVAEDEPLVRRLLETTLARLGYRVLAVEDGEAAVRAFEGRAGAIDLVVLDVVMPKIGGEQAYRRMKAMRSALKAILTTGYAPESARIAALAEAEGLPIVTKPFSPSVLARKVREVLDAR